jgi:Arc/MetJ family transcription regulator
VRTNIEIDDKLMQQAIAASDATTKKAVVEEALQLLVDIKGQGAIDELWGTVTWRGHDDDWFAPDPLDPERSGTIASQPNPNPNASDVELVRAGGLAREHGNR